MKIGTIVKQIRLESGLTQQDLADMMRVCSATIWNLENDKFQFAFCTITKFCQVMKIPFVELIARSTELKDLPHIHRHKYAGKFKKVRVVIDCRR